MPEIKPDIHPSQDRRDAGEAVSRILHRLPLVADVLQRINEAALPSAGDDELRRGCERAITSILAELARLDPAGHTHDDTISADQWLDKKLRDSLDVVTVERIEQLIARVLANRA